MAGATKSREKPRSPRLRYSVRTLLIGIALVATWLGLTVYRAGIQRSAVAEIQSAGGTVMYAYQNTAPRTVSSVGRPRGPEWMRRLLGPEYFDRPVWITLFGTPKDGGWIGAVNKLPTLKYLLLSGGNVTDETLQRLADKRNLWELHLSGSMVSDVGLMQLAKFPNLRWLVINDTEITDDGVVYLAALHRLDELTLMNTRVTDRSVPQLGSLQSLSQIDIRHTAISRQGAEKLRKLLPNCQVLF